ncbi:MAG: hypothetical protein JWL71_2442 [Acidobacteria bacterium]|nr:hypothetical protein [Acidobacteriota bacterium]
MSGRGSAAVPILTKHGVAWPETGESLAALTAAFSRSQCVQLPSLLDPSLVTWAQQAIARGRFRDKTHGEAATELCLDADPCVGALHFLVNDPAVYRLVEALAACGPVRSFFGRVYRHVPGAGHFHDWHGDVTRDRLIGMSINLSAAPYAGGLFEIRRVGTERPLASLANHGAGDAILFGLGDTLEHRVTALHGSAPKTAFAGWFRRDPDYLQELRGTVTDTRA